MCHYLAKDVLIYTTIFNLIPTDPLEYQVYADYLEDQGTILTTAIRRGILPFDTKIGDGSGIDHTRHFLYSGTGGDNRGWGSGMSPDGIYWSSGYCGFGFSNWGGPGGEGVGAS